MNAFTNTPITKDRFVFHLKEHQKMDAFLAGTYQDHDEDSFRGCAVGCSINSINVELGEDLDVESHILYEKYLGVPEWVARLEDSLFEGMPEERQKTFPLEFGEAINVGADLDQIKVPFIVYLMKENLRSLDSINIDEKEHKQVFDSIERAKKAVTQMIEAQESGDQKQIESARSAAWSAAKLSAEAAKWAAESVESAGWAATWAAESASTAGRSVAVAAAWAASESAAWAASESAAFEKYANEFLKLIKECD